MPAEPAHRIWLLEAAEDDIAAAFEWYESMRAGLGVEFIGAVDTALEPVLEFPESCEVFYRDTHRCLVATFPFEVFYRVEDDLIVVVACMHGARDPKAMLQRIA